MKLRPGQATSEQTQLQTPKQTVTTTTHARTYERTHAQNTNIKCNEMIEITVRARQKMVTFVRKVLLNSYCVRTITS